MIRHCRAFALAMAVAGFAVFGFAASAHAEPNDQQFIDQVNALGIPVGPNDDVPLIGQRVCETLTSGLTGNPNPVPIVRGMVGQLEEPRYGQAPGGGSDARVGLHLLPAARQVHGPLTPPARTDHRTPAVSATPVGRLTGCSHFCPASPGSTTCARSAGASIPPVITVCPAVASSNSICRRCRRRPRASIRSR